MKKGEMKKQEIIRTAETLFCRYGYDSTGIQEIIDTLHTSKGSFYHHFESKEALLEEICRSHLSVPNENKHKSENNSDPVTSVNSLLSEMVPFTGEKNSFLLMLLPLFKRPEGVHLRSFYSRELYALYLKPLAEEIRRGEACGLFSCIDAELTAEIILVNVNHLWMKICELILENEASEAATDPADLLAVVAQYRLAVERLLSAPYGSITIVSLTDVTFILEQIHLHWKKRDK